MNKVFSLLLVLAVVTGCAGRNQEVVSPLSSPSQQGQGLTDVFGLKVALDSAKWKELERTSGTLTLEYNPDGKDCQGKCSMLLLSKPVEGVDGDYYRANLASKSFITSADCLQGTTRFGEGKQQADFVAGGVASNYYINDPCLEFRQGDEGPNQQPRRFNWHFPEKHLLVQYVETASGVRIEDTGLEQQLHDATWL
jgi:hypothetical protein